jgi:DNA-binding NtrC family response regulator
MEPVVLVSTTDPDLRRVLLQRLASLPVAVEEVPPEPLEEFAPRVCDLAILDLPGLVAAARWAPRFKELRQSCQIVLLTPKDDPPNPEDLAAWGVRNWLGRPVEPERVLEVVERALSHLTRRGAESWRHRRGPGFAALLGQSPNFLEVLETARKAAASPHTTVLILGETGTGKQLLAQALHEASPRAGGPFLDLNCAALPPNLLESELFGHERGAFTGATRQKPGLLEMAHGGTVFLDEIGDLEPSLQVKLLKFLDTRKFRRLNGLSEIQVDVRLIAATHRDLEAEVRAGRFREDLYHRINVVTLWLPPLRERPEDIPLLAEHFLRRQAAQRGQGPTTLTDAAREVLQRYPWPGNVRELEHVMERCGLLHPQVAELDVCHLPADLTVGPERGVPEGGCEPGKTVIRFDGEGVLVELPDRPVRWDDVERAILRAALRATGGNVSEAARRLGLGRGQFRYRIQRLGLEVPGPRRYRPRRRMRRRPGACRAS